MDLCMLPAHTTQAQIARLSLLLEEVRALPRDLGSVILLLCSPRRLLPINLGPRSGDRLDRNLIMKALDGHPTDFNM
jgi:hypothetical protein